MGRGKALYCSKIEMGKKFGGVGDRKKEKKIGSISIIQGKLRNLGQGRPVTWKTLLSQGEKRAETPDRNETRT